MSSSPQPEQKVIDYIGTAKNALNTFCIADNIPTAIIDTQKLLEENEVILSNCKLLTGCAFLDKANTL